MNARRLGWAAVTVLAAVAAGAAIATDTVVGKGELERGRYVVKIAGCNDCHTPGYAESGGKVPEGKWLTGAPVGFQGPWGTTYPVNLRLAAQAWSEEQWMVRTRQAMRPPMPWFALRDMDDADLRAVYRYIRSLGPEGAPAPAYAGPGQPVTTPFIVFVPQEPGAQMHAAR